MLRCILPKILNWTHPISICTLWWLLLDPSLRILGIQFILVLMIISVLDDESGVNNILHLVWKLTVIQESLKLSGSSCVLETNHRWRFPNRVGACQLQKNKSTTKQVCFYWLMALQTGIQWIGHFSDQGFARQGHQQYARKVWHSLCKNHGWTNTFLLKW